MIDAENVCTYGRGSNVQHPEIMTKHPHYLGTCQREKEALLKEYTNKKKQYWVRVTCVRIRMPSLFSILLDMKRHARQGACDPTHLLSQSTKGRVQKRTPRPCTACGASTGARTWRGVVFDRDMQADHRWGPRCHRNECPPSVSENSQQCA
jgi:hypothetical protein